MNDECWMPTTRIIPVILSGGSGTRLWPISRESFPKQLWPLTGGHTLIQQTALRACGPGFMAPIIVCNHEHRFLIAEQLRAVGINDAKLMLEPIGRNSAPAITAAALVAAEDDPDAILWILAADHVIADEAALRPALATAALAARHGRFVTFGMRPIAPETGYGYIEPGEPLPCAPGAHAVVRFVEKPDAATATRLIADGRYLWNSGMFVFTARTLLQELETYVPDVLCFVRQAVNGRRNDLDFIRLDEAAFHAAPSISIDYAIAERTKVAAVVPADIGWSDVGSWNTLCNLGTPDATGNIAIGDVVLEGSHNCYVRSDDILTAVVGLEDAVVVVTKDAVLAMHRDHAQDVKQVVERLKSAGRQQAVAHNRVYRPWGFYESLILSDHFQVKRIVVSPGARLSLQKHSYRSEHWVVVQGTAKVTRDAEVIILGEDASIYLPLGCTHRLENTGTVPLELIEVQLGSYIGEDDIVRLEDNYGRS